MYGYLKSEKALLSWIVNVMRRYGWQRHPVKLVYSQRARVKAPVGKNGRRVYAIQCEHCKKHFQEADVEVNHKVNCIQNGISWETLGDICKRMFDVKAIDLEHLCKECHALVTFTERYGGTIEEARLEKKVIKFGKLKATMQKAKLERAGLVPAKTAVLRKEQVRQYLNKGSRNEKASKSITSILR